MIRRVCAILVVVVAGCAGGPQPRSSVPLQIANISVHDQARDRDIAVRVSAPAARRPAPIVVLSHGGGSSKDGYARVADYWAAHGYVVLAPTHEDSKTLGFDFAKAGGPKMTAITLSRLADVRYIATHLDDIAAAVPGLAAKLDRSKLVAAGHSMGGATALVTAGVKLKNKADGSILAADDVGFRYLVLLSETGANPVMPDEPWRASPVPTFIYTGTNDRGTESTGRKSPFGYNLVENASSSSQPKHYLWIDGVDHYLGGLWCDDTVKGPPDPVALDTFNIASTAFLDAYTKNDAKARHFLASPDLAAISHGRATLSLK